MLNTKLYDVNNLVNNFLLDKQSGIIKLHELYFKNNNQVSYKDLIEQSFEELKNECIIFINKNNNLNDLDLHLFYTINDFCKRNTVKLVKKQKEYLCPGCLFLGIENLISLDGLLTCYNCLSAFKNATDSKWIYFFNTFKRHSKIGFKCSDCERFIPKPAGLDTNIVCPYIDCCFVGNIDSLKKMNHPNIDTKNKKYPLKNGIISLTNENISLIKPKYDDRAKAIINVIDEEITNSHWNSFNFSVKHKLFVCQAFKNILLQFPKEMSAYLLDNSRSGGFQHKIFQEYISILEKNIPFLYKQNKKIFNISSLLDKKLSLFDGVSVFKAIVSDKLVIKNKTEEIYIGGRKSSYVKPYYIGKLLNVVLTDTNEPIMHLVESYSFSRIKLKNIKPNTNVIVTHLRVPPHYQMGGMVYVNRIRKKIINKVNDKI